MATVEPPSPQEIRSLREARGETQEEFARALGLSRAATISDWERGKQTPEPYLSLALERLRHTQRNGT